MNIFSNSSLILWILIFLLFLSVFVIFALIMKNKELKEKINSLNNLIEEKDKNINLLKEIEIKKEVVKEDIKEIKKKEEVEEIEEEKKEIIKEEIKQEPIREEKVNLYNNTKFKPSSVIPSPIGIMKEEIKEIVDNKQLEIKFEEPKEEIDEIEQEDEKQLEINFNALKEDKKQDNVSFMSEVSKKLEEAAVPSTIELTDYEKKQEEEAIISYKELIENKDKLYNITDDEEDIDFIEELKSFRNDL